MKRKLTIMPAMLLAAVLAMPSAMARNVSPSDTVRHDKIDSTVVRAYSFYESSISAFGATFIDPSQLSLQQNATVEQTLRLMPFIDIRERGGKSIQTDIGIRGGGADQTGMLLNGVDFTDIRTGHQTHSLPIDADILSQVRLLDGGNQGLTGAVNMIAGPAYEDYLRLNLSGGAFGYAYANLSGATTVTRKGTLRLFEAASLKRSDGYRQSTDFVNYNLYTRAQYTHPVIGSIDAQAGYQNRGFGANGFYSLKYPDQYEQTQTGIASVRWNKTAGRFLLESYLSYRHNTDRFELIRGSEAKVPFNYHVTDNYGAFLSAGYVSLAGRTTLSGEYHRGDILSTVLGEAVDSPRQVPGACGRFYTKAASRSWGNVQLRHQKQWDRASLKASVEGDFTPFGFTPIYNAGFTYRIADGLEADLLAARTMRLPTYTDLYYTAAGYIGNPDLVPEKADLIKLGLNYRKGIFAVDGDLFYRHGTDLIDWVKDSAEADWRSMQITKMDTFGADLTAAVAPESGIVRNISAMFGYIDSGKSSKGMISKYAMDYMRFKASLIADFSFGKHLSFSLNASCYDREGQYVDAQGNTLDYAPYAILNSSISYTAGPARFYIDMDNMTSTEYFDFGGLQMPGFWAIGGVVITLK